MHKTVLTIVFLIIAAINLTFLTLAAREQRKKNQDKE